MIPGYARIEAGRVVETRGDARHFQAASLGKMVIAVLARRHLDLDAPLATKAWVPSFDASDITVRDVLMHRAGLSVPDYPGREPDAPVPTLAQSLDGIGAPEPLRRVGSRGRFAYSGGGYTWLQLAIEETTGRSFDDLVREWDLRAGPAGLDCETGHNAAGNALPFYRYDGAAAGLLATPSSFARFLIETPLEGLVETTIETGGVDGLWPLYGLGIEIDGPIIGHHGINRGWRALAAFDPATRDGIVLFVNRDGTEAELEEAYRAWRKR